MWLLPGGVTGGVSGPSVVYWDSGFPTLLFPLGQGHVRLTLQQAIQHLLHVLQGSLQSLVFTVQFTNLLFIETRFRTRAHGMDPGLLIMSTR